MSYLRDFMRTFPHNQGNIIGLSDESPVCLSLQHIIIPQVWLIPFLKVKLPSAPLYGRDEIQPSNFLKSPKIYLHSRNFWRK